MPSRVRLATSTLFIVYLLMFWADLKSFRPGMDAMTYGALAKHMLVTGDWAVPHYTSQAYANFFQHPPLAIWLMAITMKITGSTADWVLKLLPALVGGITAIGVYLFARRIRGSGFAFLATLILLTSTRFAKYSKGFMLDPFLAMFSVWAVYLACVSRTHARRPLYASLSGLFVAGAFLSKGLFAFAPLAVILLIIGRSGVIPFLLSLFVPVVLWFALGDAANYLSHYYSEHVADRLGNHPFRDHLGPLLNLSKVYWPWLPFFLIGAWKSLRVLRDPSKREESAITLTALAFIGGFCLVASFLEQYHTATYPFAALVAAMGVPASWARFQPKAERVLLLVAVAFLANSLIRPYSMQGTEYKNPIRIALKSAKSGCTDPAIRRIAISTGVAEIWYALAMGSWNTDWDARSDAPGKTPEETGSQILLAAKSDAVAPGWIPTGIETERLRIYRSSAITDCRI